MSEPAFNWTPAQRRRHSRWRGKPAGLGGGGSGKNVFWRSAARSGLPTRRSRATVDELLVVTFHQRRGGGDARRIRNAPGRQDGSGTGRAAGRTIAVAGALRRSARSTNSARGCCAGISVWLTLIHSFG